MSTTESTQQKCTAPTPTPCPLPHYSGELCEGHYRRKQRAEDAGKKADLSTPIRQSTGPVVRTSTRISSEAHLFYFTHALGEYEALRKVLEDHAAAELAKLSPEQRKELEQKAKALRRKKQRRAAA